MLPRTCSDTRCHDEAADTAGAALKALGRRRTVIPGARGKFLTTALRPLPRRLRSLILGRVIAGMRTRETANT